MTEQEALEAFFAEWHKQANEIGESLTQPQRDCAEEAWHAALAWLRSQGEPVAYCHTMHMESGQTYTQHSVFDGSPFGVPGVDYDESYNVTCTPLFLAPQSTIPDGYGDTDFGFTFAGISLTEGDNRLMSMLVTALGTDHPAIDDITALLFAARTASQQPAIPDGWQKIESAPKDGTNVLLVNRNGNMATGLWQGTGASEGWWIRGGAAPNVFFNGHHGPTHWMPLPDAPEPSK